VSIDIIEAHLSAGLNQLHTDNPGALFLQQRLLYFHVLWAGNDCDAWHFSHGHAMKCMVVGAIPTVDCAILNASVAESTPNIPTELGHFDIGPLHK
jgi:hypothetical protein